VDEKESVGSEMLPPSGLPPYQKLLMHFLDKKAPALGKWHLYESETCEPRQ